MSDLREHLLLAASDIKGDWPTATELRTRGARRRTRRRMLAGAAVGVSAVVVVALAAVAQHPQAQQQPATPAVPCPVAVTTPAPVRQSDVPVVDVTRGRLAFADENGVWVASAGAAPVHVASPTDQAPSGGHAWSPASPELALSVDGDEVVMTTQAHGDDPLAACGDVVLAHADGSGVRLLSHNEVGSTSFHPTFSPDGRTVAYLVEHVAAYSGPDPSVAPGTPAAHFSLVLAPLAGRGRELPLDCWPNVLAWAPDGRHLALGCDDGITLASTQDDVVTQVALPKGRMSAGIGWTGDATMLAALPNSGEPQDDLLIAGYDLAARAWTQVSTPVLDVEWGVPFPVGGFSPTGQVLLATGSQIGGTAQNHEDHFYPIDVASGSVDVNSALDGKHARWTPVGWAADSDDLLVCDAASPGARLLVVAADGGSPRSVATGPATLCDGYVPGSPAWREP